MTQSIVLSSGGTGGHVYPAQSLAEELKKRGYPVAIMTDHRGKIFQDNQAIGSVHSLSIRQGKGRGAFIWLGLSLFVGIFQSLLIYRRLKPAAIVGFGGYPSVPAVIAGWVLRIPIAIHEQNAVLGRANRLVARFARRLAVSFAHTKYVDDSDKVLTGNPVRPSIVAVGSQGYVAPLEEKPLRVFIVGGSQGAKIFSQVIPAAFETMSAPLRHCFQITQQCRKEMLDETRAGYSDLGMIADVQPFFQDIDQKLKEAHLVISRSGASTVAELTVAGRPAIFVPYAAAMDNHQQANAQELCTEGAAWMILEKDFTSERLAALLKEILEYPEELVARSEKMFTSGRPNAVEKLADMVEDLLQQT